LDARQAHQRSCQLAASRFWFADSLLISATIRYSDDFDKRLRPSSVFGLKLVADTSSDKLALAKAVVTRAKTTYSHSPHSFITNRHVMLCVCE